MIQVWTEVFEDDTSYTRLAHFDSNGTSRFASFEGGYAADDARKALLESGDIRTDIKPRKSAKIIWHDNDQAVIAAFFKSMVADAQDKALATIIKASQGRINVYMMKNFELLAMKQGMPHESMPIFSQESKAEGMNHEKLLAAWTKNSEAWVYLIGSIEAAGTTAKHRISQAIDDTEMRSIVDGFISSLKEMSSSD